MEIIFLNLKRLIYGLNPVRKTRFCFEIENVFPPVVKKRVYIILLILTLCMSESCII